MEGLEGMILLELLLGDGMLHDMDSADISKMSAEQLIELIHIARARLEELSSGGGMTHAVYPDAHRTPRRLRITRSLRIFLEGKHEIRLKPLCKTIFLLYLRHPEGIEFKEMSLHRRELCDIYARVSRRSSMEAVERSIDKLLDMGGNSISTHRSQLARELSRQIESEILPHYLMYGRPGQKRKIPLERDFIEWE